MIVLRGEREMLRTGPLRKLRLRRVRESSVVAVMVVVVEEEERSSVGACPQGRSEVCMWVSGVGMWPSLRESLPTTQRTRAVDRSGIEAWRLRISRYRLPLPIR